MLVRRFHEQRDQQASHQIDYAGAILLAVGGSLLLLGLLEGGVMWAWDSPASIAILVAAVVLLIAFVLVERRAAEPILPLWVLGKRVLNSANSAALLIGVLMIGLSTYVPLFAQGVLGTSALVAGFALAAMTLGWPIAASLAGRIYLRVGFRTTMLFGSVDRRTRRRVCCSRSTPASAVLHLAAACFVIGIGLGFSASPSVVAAQSSVAWQTRGVVTGANMFARSVGSAVGVAVFGAVANGVVAARLGDRPRGPGEAPAGKCSLLPSTTCTTVPQPQPYYWWSPSLFMPNRITEQPLAGR